jgi:lysophospholipase L1-like esterase
MNKTLTSLLHLSIALAFFLPCHAAEKSQLIANLEAGKNQVIVTYGTSLTAAGGWVGGLQDALDERFPGKATVINSGKSGQWSEWGVTNLKERVLQKNPDAVFIEFSINDSVARFNATVEMARANLESMITLIHKQNPRCEIILMTMTPGNGHPVGHFSHRKDIEKHYEMYRAVAKAKGLLLIDHDPNWRALQSKDPEQFKKWVPDTIHATDEGCARVVTPLILSKLGIVEAVHRQSHEIRKANLERALAQETLWPQGAWGDVMWALSLLYLDQRTGEANERLVKLAGTKEPFAYFGSVDYIRILCLFGKDSPHFPGRLTPEAEAAMKRVLWDWSSEFQRHYFAVLEQYKAIEEQYPMIDTDHPEWLLYASENHDLIRKTGAYLFFSVIKDDPEYRDREVGNGLSVRENFDFYNDQFKRLLKQRATGGLWMEMGAGYAKYSYATVFNLHDLSPDPELRRLAKMFLDVALIEEAQISFRDGYRAGAMSRLPRVDLEVGGMMVSHAKLLYGEKGGASTHSRVIETSGYEVPAIAVFLRHHADQLPPFEIRNRMLGESAGPNLGQGEHEGSFHGAVFPISPEPAIVNICYRTPEYAMGGAVQDPKGNDSGITRQDRWSGILFNDAKRSRIVPMAETVNKSTSTRVHDAYWNVQHGNLMISRKMPQVKYMGRLMVHFSPTLERVEKNGWVFATNGKAHAAVKAVGGHKWETSAQAWPDKSFLFSEKPDAPFFFLAGGVSDGFGSLDEFQDYVLNRVSISESQESLVIRRPNKPEVVYFPDGRPATIGGEPLDLKPPMAYDSPYLRSQWQSGIVEATWGSLESTYDFNKAVMNNNFEMTEK